MTQPPVVILTSDHHAWIIPAMLAQMERHWRPLPERVIVAGFTPPPFLLPAWVEWYSIGEFANYPADKWSDGLRDFLKAHRELTHFILLLEDYLCTRTVDVEAVEMLYQLAQNNPGVLRVDLCSDRAGNSAPKVEVGYLGRLDLIEIPPPAEYHVSTQPSIWNRDRLAEILKRNESAWQFELDGTNRANHLNQRVIGTRQAPMRIKIAINKGHFDLETPWQWPPTNLTAEDTADLRKRKLIPDGV